MNAGDEPRSRARARVLEAELANLSGAEGARESAEAAAARRAGAGRARRQARRGQGVAGRGGNIRAPRSGRRCRAGARPGARRSPGRPTTARGTTAVLARAPRAALWGPSPVVRASGRCLDVVRILRMTPGNRHVEAIALRCQAVLEAMRGRTDAAREILAAGRATLEELGLALELHETAVHAGMVELLAEDPSAAAEHLRGAREGFEALGVSSGAAQAAALLARALIEQGGRDEEALQQSEFAERHGGGDLKTTITWCSARAEALARGGDAEQALSLARRAVALAEPTDALADKADASMALAGVLLAAGREQEAREAAGAARELYESKGHGQGAKRAHALASPGERPLAASESDAPLGSVPPLARAPEQRVLGDRVPERFWATLQQRANARDYDGLSELIAADLTWKDHRALGWEQLHGREQVMAELRSTFGASPGLHLDFDEVLACDDRVIALRMAWRGHGVKAGELELVVASVFVTEDGLWRSADFYEPDDRAGALARYEELGGRLPAADIRPPEKVQGEYRRLFEARDLDALLDLYSEDVQLVDHRALAWDTVSGRAALAASIGSAFAIADQRIEIDEVLACDDHVSASCATWRGQAADGGGLYERAQGTVTLIRDGRIASHDIYEPDDRQAMIARYAELGGGQAALGDRPPERFYAEYVRRIAGGDPQRLAELYAQGWRSVDHRQLGWVDENGRDAALAALRSAFEGFLDLRVEVEEVLACDDRVIALVISWCAHALESGGEAELRMGTVMVVESDQAVSADQYDAEAREDMLARYAELGGQRALAGEHAPERLWAECARYANARDYERVLDFLAEDCRWIDHRPLGWETARGRVPCVDVMRSTFGAAPDVRMECDEVLACDERALAVRLAWRGAGVKAGDWEVQVGAVADFMGGRWRSTDFYEPDDREAMLARFAELSGSGAASGGRPPERWFAEFQRRWDAHDQEGLLELYTEDWVMTDHRTLALWEPVQGKAAQAALNASVFEVSPDTRFELDEVLACDGRVIAMRAKWLGSAPGGGGESALDAGGVWVIESGLAVSGDVYEPDAREAMLARFAELAGDADPPGVFGHERIADDGHTDDGSADSAPAGPVGRPLD